MRLATKKTLDYVLGGTLLALVRPLVFTVGRILKRNHEPKPRGQILVAKVVGGGSLVIAYPALLGLKRKYPSVELVLLTTSSVKPFAEILKVFDRVYVLEDSSLWSLFASFVKLYPQLVRTDTCLDFEVYSRLSTLLGLFILARNRVGFHLEGALWRKWLHTHLIFFNRFRATYSFYEAAVRLLGAEPETMQECRKHFAGAHRIQPSPDRGSFITLGFACSELGAERMLPNEQWATIWKRRENQNLKILKLLGGKSDFEQGEQIRQFIIQSDPTAQVENLCGRWSLVDSIREIAQSQEFWGIDSSLLHFSRLLAVPSQSFWGPTSPASRLKPIANYNERTHYLKLACSPCVHVVEQSPCGGYNICMKNLTTEKPERGFVPIEGPNGRLVLP